jgi:hypothetical protein
MIYKMFIESLHTPRFLYRVVHYKSYKLLTTGEWSWEPVTKNFSDPRSPIPIPQPLHTSDQALTRPGTGNARLAGL